MSYAVELHVEAVQELQEAYVWYEERSEGLGDRFITLLNRRLGQIAENPERYPRKKGRYHEALLDVFPYVIIYEVFKKERLVFVSYIFHSKRNPLLKYKR